MQYGVLATWRVPAALTNLHALRCESRLSPYRSIDRAGPASGTLLATGAGVHLVEVLIAASLLAGVCVSLPRAFVGAIRANRAAGEVTWTTVLAAQKVEELRSGAFPPAVVIESSELLGEAGEPVDGPSSTPAFGRLWRTEPLASAPDDTVVITVLVAPYRRAALTGVNERPPGATRLVTLRTRKAR
jgi:hypothetical protein